MRSSSTSRTGVQEPRIKIEQSYEIDYGEDAIALAAAYGLVCDPWQEIIVHAWLGQTSDFKWAHPTCGILVPRQNGKNGAVEVRELFGLVVLGEKILHTAHEVKTSMKAFKRLKSFFGSKRNDPDAKYPELNALVESVSNTNGQEAIFLKNGGSIEFSSRSRGGSRGFTVDLTIYDEAQELTDEQLEASSPAKAAAPLQNPQTIYLGTPPNQNIQAEVFGRVRKNALLEMPRICWHEWSVEEIGDVRDRERWYACNPALGIRIMESTVEDELNNMGEDGFARERLAWWVSSVQNAVFDYRQWESLATDDPPADGKMVYGVKFSPTGDHVSLAVALKPKTGKNYVEVIEHRSTSSGDTWLVDWLEARWRKTALIVIDGKSGAQSLYEKLLARKIGKTALCQPKTNEVVSAYQMMLNDVREESVSHFGQPVLNAAVEKAVKRRIGNDGGFGYSGAENTDVSPLEAASLALWGVKTTKRNPGRKQVII